MKANFYALSLMASLALSATAAEVGPLKWADTSKLTKVENSLLKPAEGKSKEAFKVPASGKDLTGDYLTAYTNLVGNDEVAPRNVNAEAYIQEGEGENEYVINFPFVLGQDVFTIDIPFTVSGNVITLTPVTLNVMGQPCPLTLGIFNPQVGDITIIDEITVPFTGTGFTFPEGYVFGAGDTTEGFYFVANNTSVQKADVPDDELNLGWKSVGMATFQDGWILPALCGGEQANPEYWYEVELQQCEDDENLYRLVNPYGAKYCPFAEYNEFADRNGFIQFNVKDPDHVYFDVVPANFANSQQDISQTYCYNLFTYIMDYYGWSFEDAIEEYDKQVSWTTFKDGVVTVPTVFEKGIYDNNALFGIEGHAMGGYSWGTSISMEAKIFFPKENGIDDIIDNSNAPVKYFNLQGVEVANPEKGQLVIKKQGTKAEKLIVR